MTEKGSVRIAPFILLPLLIMTGPALVQPAAQEDTAAAYSESTDAGQDGNAVTQFPAQYDCRDYGKIPVIKSQGETGTCWALSATSALEASLLPQIHRVFSADHMSLNNGFVITQEEGGDYRMIMAYLSGWYGPVTEEEDPYGDGVTRDGLAASAHVQEMIILQGEDASAFKQMILTTGPVQSSLYMDRKTTSQTLSYYNEETCSYCYTQKKKPTHDVLILGWDDAWPKEAFATQPEGDGAWICQNTWGEDFGLDGIFYVSYEDASFLQSGIAYAQVDAGDGYDRIYQTDVCGWQGRQGYDVSDCSFANVYTARDEEILEAAGFYSTGKHSDYKISLVHAFEGTGSFDDAQLLAEGSLEGIGYFTVPFEEGVRLAAGERFALVVDLHTEGAKKPVAVELKKDSYTQNVTLEGKEGYISLYGEEWESAEEKYGTNICLKAYTSLPGKEAESIQETENVQETENTEETGSVKETEAGGS